MDDDDSLIVSEDDGRENELKAREIRRIFLRLGITQIVLGCALIVGGVAIAATWPDWGPDRYGEGIWCGVFVMICGAMAITARYHLHIGVVIASLAINVLTAVLLSAGSVCAAVSMFSHIDFYSRNGDYVEFAALNMGLLSCSVLSIYLTVVFGKVLNGRRRYCCFGPSSQNACPGYAMVYVPTTAQANSSSDGAFMAVPSADDARSSNPDA